MLAEYTGSRYSCRTSICLESHLRDSLSLIPIYLQYHLVTAHRVADYDFGVGILDLPDVSGVREMVDD